MTKKRKPQPKQEPRPGDILLPPELPKIPAGTAPLPKSWQTVIDTAKKWPYVDPRKAMATRDPDFADYSPVTIEEEPTDEWVYSASEPWGKMDDETGREYQWFSYYRSLGISRKKKDVAEHFNVTSSSVNKCVQKNDWDERIIAWDRYREEEYTKAVIAGVREMAQTHADIAREGIEALASVFKVLQGRIARGDLVGELEDMPAKTLFSIVQKSAQIIPNLMNAERLSRGMPTDIQAQFSQSESIVKFQTSDELTEIVSALTGILGPGKTENSDSDQFDDGWGEDQIIEIIDPEDE